MSKTPRPANRIAVVFGASGPGPGETQWQVAFELGRALGQAGFTVANGGYGGTMAASARGAREAGAHTIGVTCDCFGPFGPNQYIKEEIRATDLCRRLQVLVDLGDCFLVLPGMTGTLAEFALAWELVAKRLTRSRPIVCLGEFWRPIIDHLAAAGAKTGRWLLVADDVESAVAAANSWRAADA